MSQFPPARAHPNDKQEIGSWFEARSQSAFRSLLFSGILIIEAILKEVAGMVGENLEQLEEVTSNSDDIAR
jgi:hypothetical protein